MELVVSVVAILVAGVALALVLTVRNQVAQLLRGHPGAELAQLRQEVSDIRHDMEQAQRELEELKAATQVVPAPPLPRARSAGLSDLREQLRAAHREPEPDSEE